MSAQSHLSRRERQIMDAVYGKGEATATDVLATISDPPTRTAVRTLLRILEAKRHLKHFKRGREFVYQPTHSRESAGKSAFGRAIRTFFDGSLERAVAAYLGDPEAAVAPDELRRLSSLITQARRMESRDSQKEPPTDHRPASASSPSPPHACGGEGRGEEASTRRMERKP